MPTITDTLRREMPRGAPVAAALAEVGRACANTESDPGFVAELAEAAAVRWAGGDPAGAPRGPRKVAIVEHARAERLHRAIETLCQTAAHHSSEAYEPHEIGDLAGMVVAEAGYTDFHGRARWDQKAAEHRLEYFRKRAEDIKNVKRWEGRERRAALESEIAHHIAGQVVVLGRAVKRANPSVSACSAVELGMHAIGVGMDAAAFAGWLGVRSFAAAWLTRKATLTAEAEKELRSNGSNLGPEGQEIKKYILELKAILKGVEQG
jgi:hypothetical protein